MDGDWIAHLDQIKANCGDTAQMLATYRDQLLQAGFTRQEALQLVLGLQTSAMLESRELEDGG